MIAVLSMTQPLLAGEPLEQPTVLDAIPTPPIFQNPFMAPNNFSEIHLNAYQTDTTSASGPASASSQAVQQGLLRPITSIAGTMAFNARGQILTIRVGASPTTPGEDAQTLLLINPETLTVLAETDLPPRPSSGTVVSFSGGGYFYVDHLDRVVCVTATQEIRIYAVQNTQFVLAQTYDLSAQIDDASDVLNSVLPDSAEPLVHYRAGARGVCQPGERDDSPRQRQGGPGREPERNQYQIVRDRRGRGRLCRLGLRALPLSGRPRRGQDTWRAVYDRGVRTKPGQNQQGSGTTPTVFNDFDGNQFVAIADNADPFLHVNVYNRQTGDVVAQQAVFSAFPGRNSAHSIGFSGKIPSHCYY